jgi:hypothetical protein
MAVVVEWVNNGTRTIPLSEKVHIGELLQMKGDFIVAFQSHGSH